MTAPPPPGSVLPVLIVDDDASIRRLFRFVLEEAGFVTIEAGGGEEALRIASSQRLAAVLLDARMPGRDGISVLTALRERRETATLPVLIVTGSGEITERIRGLEAGANDYVTKPVHADELVARVRAQIRGQAAWLREVDERLRERAALTDRLARIQPSAHPVEAASAFCGELAAADVRGGFAIVAFAGDGTAWPVGASGHGTGHLSVGRPFSHRLASQLRAQLRRGAWVEHLDQQPAGALGVPLFDSSADTAAYAVVRGQQGALGVLGVARPDVTRVPDAAVEHLLSSAIDYASIATALLGPLLGEHFTLAGRRASLRDLLRTRAYEPHYQPIVDLEDGRAVGHEVLTRFHDGSTPEKRFGEAVALGMAVEMEHATIATALVGTAALPADSWVSVNVSPALLIGDDQLSGLLSDSARPVVLELTEHDRIDDYGAVRDAVTQLGSDIRLSIDDAGSGYACLHHVLALRPDFIKLDRRWIRRIGDDPARQALVAGLAHFAGQTGITAIAEGVEEPDEVRVLTELGVRLGQGFLLGRPAPIAAPA